jgi:beta-galactosidase GanA
MRWALSTLRLLGFSLLCLAGTAAHTWQVPLFSSAPPAREPWSPALSFAVAYYPTQWAPSQWASDARRMAAAGIRFVRLAEFDWALLEPRAGTFNFSTLDAALHVLDSHGLQVILGTPTATPPRWAVREYDILGADADGKPRRWGSRRSYSFSAPDYRMLSERITNKLAQRYGQDRRVVAWQVSSRASSDLATE